MSSQRPMRSELHIYNGLENKKLPIDLIAIMMNPGSSKPADDSYERKKWRSGQSKEFVLAVHDKTQERIMDIMYEFNFKKALIINLSDIQEPKSKKFYELLKNARHNQSHSIFSSQRLNEIPNLKNTSIPIICAWGLSKHLLPLAEKAFEQIKNCKFFGLQKNTDKPLFRHPLPPSYWQQTDIVSQIKNQIRLQK